MLPGDYFDDITLWFSDTFPGWEDWMSLSRYVSSFHGYSEIAVEGELTMSDVIISPYLTLPRLWTATICSKAG